GDPQRLRTDLPAAAQGHFLRPAAGAAVPDRAPLQHGSAAAAGAAAEDAAQHRRPGPRPLSRSRPVADRQALPGTLDARAARPATLLEDAEARLSGYRRRAPRTAAAGTRGAAAGESRRAGCARPGAGSGNPAERGTPAAPRQPAVRERHR